MRQLLLSPLFAASLLLPAVTSCAGMAHHDGDGAHHEHADAAGSLVAVMTPTAGNEARGTVTFAAAGHGVVCTATISGLTPGDHAIHIHEFGDIRLDNGKACGGHYNPEGHDHALPTSGMRHAGDLGNLTADAAGNASYTIALDNVTIDGDHNPIVGRSIIIHVGPDDGGQPTGNAGARVAQGVIGYAKP